MDQGTLIFWFLLDTFNSTVTVSSGLRPSLRQCRPDVQSQRCSSPQAQALKRSVGSAWHTTTLQEHSVCTGNVEERSENYPEMKKNVMKGVKDLRKALDFGRTMTSKTLQFGLGSIFTYLYLS
ncbi:hypothetical protein J6590_087192 [Homalodisca vitripennis]|nr:hypothetical protein J6590_087192 [Homalodisca vitripennis]